MASDGPSSASPEPPDSGGRSGGRARPGVVSSYAAIGLLKENMQAVLSRKTADSKTPSERDMPFKVDDSPGSLKLANLKADLQQRTGPSRENALLRAELELLRQQNQEMAFKLQLAQSRLTENNRQLYHSQSGLQQELISLKGALQDADLEKVNALSVAEVACSQVEAVHKTLDSLLLQPDEMEAAALQCCWLAHYWELASHFGLYPQLSSSKAAYWRALSPPDSAIIQSAKHVMKRLQQFTNQPASNGPGPEWLRKEAGKFASSMQVSAADLVEVERAMRQLQQLGVEAAVIGTLAQQAAARRAMLQLSPASQEMCVGACLTPVPLSPEEGQEVQLQQAYLAYLWGHAALLGVEPQVAASRAEQWHLRLDQPPSLRDFCDVQQAQQELCLLGIEQQLWQKRLNRPQHFTPAGNSSSRGCMPMQAANKLNAASVARQGDETAAALPATGDLDTDSGAAAGATAAGSMHSCTYASGTSHAEQAAATAKLQLTTTESSDMLPRALGVAANGLAPKDAAAANPAASVVVASIRLDSGCEEGIQCKPACTVSMPVKGYVNDGMPVVGLKPGLMTG